MQHNDEPNVCSEEQNDYEVLQILEQMVEQPPNRSSFRSASVCLTSAEVTTPCNAPSTITSCRVDFPTFLMITSNCAGKPRSLYDSVQSTVKMIEQDKDDTDGHAAMALMFLGVHVDPAHLEYKIAAYVCLPVD